MKMSFSTENLIHEIEKRPPIWDMKIPEYSDKNIRKRCWEEVTKCFCKPGCSEKEKNSLNALLQKKWKNIRDRFNREVAESLRSPMEARKKTPYMYTRQLEFLRDTLSFRITNNPNPSIEELTACRETYNPSIAEPTVCLETDNSSIADPTVCGVTYNNPPSTSSDASEESAPPRKKAKFHVEKKILEVLDRNMKERAEIAKKMREQEKNKEDAERLFLLSLLPTLKSIQPNCLLKAKMAIMNVLDEFPKINSTNEDHVEEILPNEIIQIKLEQDGFWEESCDT